MLVDRLRRRRRSRARVRGRDAGRGACGATPDARPPGGSSRASRAPSTGGFAARPARPIEGICSRSRKDFPDSPLQIEARTRATCHSRRAIPLSVPSIQEQENGNNRKARSQDARGGGPGDLAGVPAVGRSAGPRPADLHVHADGPLHRLPQGARGAGPMRRRGLPLLRAGGADPLDRALRPREGRDARAVRLDPHPRCGPGRAAPPRLGAALAAPRRARDQQRPRELPLAATNASRRARSSPSVSG